jgi:predicted ester cyclase
MSASMARDPALRFHPELFVEGHMEVADEIVAPEFVWHGAGIPDTPLGPAGVKQLAAAFRAALGGLVIENHDAVSQGDATCYRWTMRAVHRGELFGVAPTGRRIELHGFDLFHRRDGKLVELWAIVDRLELLEQVGAWPPR